MSSSNRIEWVDTARGGAILLVVMHHAALTLGAIGSRGALIEKVDYYLAMMRMPLFAIATGVITAILAEKSFQRYVSVRMVPVLWALLIWSAVQALLDLFYPIYRFSGEDLAFSVNYLWGEVGVLWFLRALILYAAVAYMARNVSGVWAAVIVAASIAIALFDFVAPPFQVVVRYAPFFAMGFFGKDLARRGGARAWCLCVLAVPMLVWMQLRDSIVEALGDETFFLVARTFGAFAGIGIAALVTHRFQWIAERCKLLGRYSLQIYVAHVLFLDVFSLPFYNVASWWQQVIILVSMTGATIGACLALNLGFRRLGMGFMYAPPALDTIRRGISALRLWAPRPR